MKYVKSYISVQTTNKTNRIGTAFELGKALSYKGGMNNTMVQVVPTNKQVTSNIEKKFKDVIKGFSNYFSRVNHAYFKSNSSNGLSSAELQTKLRNDDTLLEIIDHIKFDVGVQSFLNIDRIINFRIDMTKSKSKSKQIEPEQTVLDKIKNIISNICTNTNQNVSTTNAVDNNTSTPKSTT